MRVDGNGGQTTYALSHLKNKHNIDCRADDSAIPSTIASFSITASAGASIAATVERVFSAARRTLTPERNALGLKILEAYECLRWWWRSGIVTGRLTAGPMTPRVQVEAQFVTALLGDAALAEEDVE